jgi:putative ABC transport system substrate-binding protein
MTQKIFALALGALLFAHCATVEAQQAKLPRIGCLFSTERNQIPFRQALRDLGYIEEKNANVECRFIEGEQSRVPGLIAELLQLNVDVLVVSTLTSIRAAKQATKSTPIVIVATADPVETGIVDSLARPGGNITGVTSLTRVLNGKRLELVKETIPGISRVAVLWDPRGPGPTIAFKEYEAAARSLEIKLQSIEVVGADPDFESAFQSAAKGRANAMITIRSSVFNRHVRRIAETAIKNRLPLLSEGTDYVEAGGLMSYATNDADQNRRAAIYVDKILKGAKPGDLPIEQPTKFELVINLKTAKQIGLTIPPNVLYRADKVIK